MVLITKESSGAPVKLICSRPFGMRTSYRNTYYWDPSGREKSANIDNCQGKWQILESVRQQFPRFPPHVLTGNIWGKLVK